MPATRCRPSPRRFIYTTIVTVDIVTLFSMIAAAVLGAWLGAGIVSRLAEAEGPDRDGAGAARRGHPHADDAAEACSRAAAKRSASAARRLAIAVGGNFFLGALMTLGIGLYAPCMILVSLLGMNPTAAFPIMMGSCAFLMPVGSLRFIRERSYSLRAALGLAIGGIPGRLVAAFIVNSLPLYAVRWLVIVVVVYTAVTMLAAAFSADRDAVEVKARA